MKTIKSMLLGALLLCAGAVNINAAITSASLDYALLNMCGTNTQTGIFLGHASATNLNIPIDLRLQYDFSFYVQFNATNTDTANVTTVFAPSLDGTTNTMDTTKTFSLIVAQPGTAGAQANCLTNWSGNSYANYSGVGGYQWVILRYMTNASVTTDLTNVLAAIPAKRGRASGR